VLIGGSGGSYHLEVAAPPGVDIVGITADPVAREAQAADRQPRRGGCAPGPCGWPPSRGGASSSPGGPPRPSR
jgi:hypothetical protein